MNTELIPAILVQDRQTMLERMALVEGLVSIVQLDCMDGHFVPNRSYYTYEEIDTTLAIELHLMVSDPLFVIHAWRRAPQLHRAIWHVEIPTDHRQIIQECRALGIECGLAISPKTPIDQIASFLPDIDEVLVLGVEPGWSGQTLIPSTLQKLSEIKHRTPSVATGFDGGVTLENISSIATQAKRICLASAIFQTADPRQTLHDILSTI